MDHLRVNNLKPFNINITVHLIKSIKSSCQSYDFHEQKKKDENDENSLNQRAILTPEIRDEKDHCKELSKV